MIKTHQLQAADGSALKDVSITDEDALRQVFPEYFSGEQREPSIIDLYRQEGFVRRCVELRASALSDIPWSIYNEGGDEPVWSNEMEVPDELSMIGDLRHVLHEIEASLALLGRAYRLKEVRNGEEMGLRILPAQQMEPEQGQYTRDVQTWRRSVNGEVEMHDPEDVVAIHAPDAFTDFPTQSGSGFAARPDGRVLFALSEFLRGHLNRGLIRATLLTVEGRANEEERNRLETWWQRYFAGSGNAGRQKVVNAAVEPKQIGGGLDDLSNTDLVEQARQAISTAFGVPHSVVMSDAANYATAKADRLNLYQQTVIPDANLIEDALNGQYFRERGLRFKFHPSRVEALQSYELEKAKQVRQAVGRPVLTVDEGRELLGYEPLEEEQQPEPDTTMPDFQ